MRCYNAGRTDNEQVKIELLSQWKLEAEFRNKTSMRMMKMVMSLMSRTTLTVKLRWS